MDHDIKLVAVDIDGTFVRSDYTYDILRFRRILSRMQSSGCNFVVASGNWYYQLRDLLKDQILKFAPGIPCYDNELIARKKSVQDRRRLPLQPHPSEAEK